MGEERLFAWSGVQQGLGQGPAQEANIHTEMLLVAHSEILRDACGAGVVAKRVKLLLAMLASHMNASPGPCYSTFDPAPCQYIL